MVDCGGLENRWGLAVPEGSNPSFSANLNTQRADFQQVANLPFVMSARGKT